MHFQSITFIFGGLLAQGLMANPVANPDALIESHSEKVKGGTIVHYTDGNTTPITKRWCLFNCPPDTCQTDIVCDNDNGGPQDTCNDLVDHLYNYPDQSLANDKQMCFKSEAGNSCCIKWTKSIPNLKYGSIKDLTSDIAKYCNQGGVSAKYNKIEIEGVCTSFCMNDGAGCKDKA